MVVSIQFRLTLLVLLILEKRIQEYGNGNNNITGALKVKKQNGNTYTVSDDKQNFGNIIIKKDENNKENTVNKVENEDTVNKVENENTKLEQQKEKDTTPKTNTTNKEKDDTPKTGTETINIIGYVIATTIVSGIGIVVLKKNLK